MALTFIPQVWAARILTSLKKNLVMAQPGVVNRNYEGDIRQQGDRVNARSIGQPTIATYTKNVTSIDPETLTDTTTTLVIDQAKYFAFEVDDIDAAQTPGGELDEALTDATYGLRDLADQLIWGLYTEVAAGNQIGTVSVTTADLAYTQLRLLKQKLDEANVPMEGRWCAVPPWYHSLLLDNNKFLDASAYGNNQPIMNGEVGRALGMRILMSNNSPNTTGDDYAVLAGVPRAFSYAEQIVKVENYRPQDSFSDAVKGLHVYGAKTFYPDAVASLIASQT